MITPVSPSSRIFFLAVPILLVLHMHGTSIHAVCPQEYNADRSSHHTSRMVEEDDSGNWGELLKSCPLKIALFAPCIDTESDLSECTVCVTGFVANSGTLSSGTGDDNNSSNTNTTLTECDKVQTEVCSAVSVCSEKCGLSATEGNNGKIASFFQFGSDCDTLFTDLLACSLEAEDLIPTECSLDTCGSVDGSSSSASSFFLSRAVAATLIMVAPGVASLL